MQIIYISNRILNIYLNDIIKYLNKPIIYNKYDKYDNGFFLNKDIILKYYKKQCKKKLDYN